MAERPPDYRVLTPEGDEVEAGACPPDGDVLDGLARRLARHERTIVAALESMNAARSSTTASSDRAGRSRSPESSPRRSGTC